MNAEVIEELISKLTIEEKSAMIHGAGLFRTDGVKRLNIPPLKMSDGPIGVRHEFPDNSWVPVGNSDDYVTYLPCSLALAATWNRELAYKSGQVLGSEARGRGKDVILGPGLNIIRSPLCGRNFEYMSEDPYIAGQMAVPFIKGVQENDVSVCVKHFAVNNQETERLNVEAIVDDRTLREIYLPAFEAAVKEGHASAIMSAYNKIWGYHCSHNKKLLQEILRDEWGFDGIVISDWSAVHDTELAANAGLDIEMSVTYNFDEYYFAKPLVNAVKEGQIKEEVIDDKIRRLLRLMDKLNMFSEDRKSGNYNSPEHRNVTLETARESIVLLKNENNLLPLNHKKIKKIVVIGENANITHSNGGGSAEIKALYEITPLLGIKMRLGGNTEVKYVKGYDADKEESKELISEAVKEAGNADAVIYVGGLKHEAEELQLQDNALSVNKDEEIKRRIDSEGYDRSDMKLPYNQDELIKEVLKANKNTVIVISSGSPVDMSEWIDDADSVVQTWYNGMEGGRALAEVIFGDVNPSGKLTVTFPRKLEDSPAHKFGEFPGGKTVNYGEGVFVGYRYFSTYDVKPLFCFGHGLSYTSFKYDDLKAEVKEKDNDVYVEVSFKVTNTGKREGKETAQIYISDEISSVKRPKLELKGFVKVSVEKGKSKEIKIKLDKRALAFYSVDRKSWVIEKGNFNVFVGSSVEDIRLSKEISVDSEYTFN